MHPQHSSHLGMVQDGLHARQALGFKAFQSGCGEAILLYMPCQLSGILHRHVQALPCKDALYFRACAAMPGVRLESLISRWAVLPPVSVQVRDVDSLTTFAGGSVDLVTTPIMLRIDSED